MRAFILALFTLILAAPVAAQTPSFAISDVSVAESNGKVYVPILKTGSSSKASRLSYTTIDGTARSTSDYTRRSGNINIPAGASSARIAIPVTVDANAENAEAFQVRIRVVSNATITDDTATVTIYDSTPPVIAPTEPPPPPPDMQTCWDGSVIPATSSCPPEPPPPSPIETPPPAPSFVATTSIAAQLVPIPTTDFNPAEGVKPVSIPKSAAPDVVGAFRFVCKIDAVEFPWMLGYDDPIIWPGQPGKAHLHQFYGNTQDNIGMANYESLRKRGGSLCNQIGDQKTKALNRSLYWQAAMIEYGSMKVVQPNHLQIYYKNRPDSDIHCTGPPNTTNSTVQSDGDCVPLPDGLRFVFGFDPTLSSQLKTGAPKFLCKGPAVSSSTTYPDLTNVNTWCPKGVGNELVWDIAAPSCWDGVNLDSTNHRDHVSYPVRNNTTGLSACPATHPKKIPGFTLKAFYSLNADDSPETWDFSCRMLAPTLGRGGCGHADFYMAWDPGAKNKWNVLGCIDNLLNCASGDMGMGEMLIGATAPIYGAVSLSINPHHKVPIPPAPAGAMAP